MSLGARSSRTYSILGNQDDNLGAPVVPLFFLFWGLRIEAEHSKKWYPFLLKGLLGNLVILHCGRPCRNNI